MLYRNGTEPKKRRLDLQIIELESYIGQIIKGYDYESDKKYIKHSTGDLNAVILHFRAVVQSDRDKTFYLFDSFCYYPCFYL